jgi:hypothetical protein
VPEVAAPIEAVEPEPLPVEETIAAPQPPSQVVRRLAPAVRAPKPEPETEPPVEEPSIPIPVVEAAPEPARKEVVPPPSRQVRVLRPTAAALNAGIRPGERAPAPPPTAPAPSRERPRERTPRGRVEYTGTPGETATPQTTYIPPPDAGRRRSRRGSTRGGSSSGRSARVPSSWPGWSCSTAFRSARTAGPAPWSRPRECACSTRASSPKAASPLPAAVSRHPVSRPG